VRLRRTPAGSSTTATGLRAEDAALRFLAARGLRLVARNFRGGGGEIDLLMLDGEALVVVEVRYRHNRNPVDPALSITAAKRRRLLQAATCFLQRHREHALRTIRFDVMALTGGPGDPACHWIRHAFDEEDGH